MTNNIALSQRRWSRWPLLIAHGRSCARPLLWVSASLAGKEEAPDSLRVTELIAQRSVA